MVHPGIKRKKEFEDKQNRKDKLLREGPISLLLFYILDIVGSIFNTTIDMTTELRDSGSKFIYDAVYKDGTKLISSAEKYGNIVSLLPLRIILTIMYPPLGVFLARGIKGLVYILITFILTYINVFLGIAFAMLIIFKPGYGDRFQQYDYYRLLTIRQMLANGRDIDYDGRKDMFPLITLIVITALIISSVYFLLKYL